MRKRIMYQLCLILTFIILGTMWIYATDETKPIILKYSSFDYEQAAFGQGQDLFLKMIEEKTNIKFERYWGGSLLGTKDSLTGTGVGVSDFSLVSTAYEPSAFPLSRINELPTLQKTPFIGGMVMLDITNNLPAVQNEWTRANLKVLTCAPIPSFVFMTKPPVSSIADLKGLKIRAGGQAAITAERLGATPVTSVPSEAYEAMERGVIDGCLWDLGVYDGYGLTPATKYVFMLPTGGYAITMSMNLDKWNSLPEKYKRIIEEIAPEHIRKFQDIVLADNERVLKKMKDMGVIINYPSDEDVAYLEIIAKEYWKEWVADLEKKGLPGQEVLDTWLSLTEKYTKLSENN